MSKFSIQASPSSTSENRTQQSKGAPDRIRKQLVSTYFETNSSLSTIAKYSWDTVNEPAKRTAGVLCGGTEHPSEAPACPLDVNNHKESKAGIWRGNDIQFNNLSDEQFHS